MKLLSQEMEASFESDLRELRKDYIWQNITRYNLKLDEYSDRGYDTDYYKDRLLKLVAEMDNSDENW